MFKVGDKVKVIEENLQYENIEEYELIINFINGYDNVFEVVDIRENDWYPIVIENHEGEKMLFLEKELVKVEE